MERNVGKHAFFVMTIHLGEAYALVEAIYVKELADMREIFFYRTQSHRRIAITGTYMPLNSYTSICAVNWSYDWFVSQSENTSNLAVRIYYLKACSSPRLPSLLDILKITIKWKIRPQWITQSRVNRLQRV